MGSNSSRNLNDSSKNTGQNLMKLGHNNNTIIGYIHRGSGMYKMGSNSAKSSNDFSETTVQILMNLAWSHICC